MTFPRKDRLIALFFAGIFIISISTLTFVVIWEHFNSKPDNADTSQQAAQQGGENMLQGKPLEGFTPVAEVTELQKLDLTAGNGSEVKPGDTVTVDYTGAVAATGVVFQSSKDSGQPVTFPLEGVIKGWTEGVPGMKVGGTRRLVIPAEMAYGANPPAGSGIPANAPLVFDITLHSIGE